MRLTTACKDKTPMKVEELKTMAALIEHLHRLPSVGRKSAERMAYAFLDWSDEHLLDLSAQLAQLKSLVHPCPICGLYAEEELCTVCKDESRDHRLMVVVSYPKDVAAFERIEHFHGVYHILGGALSAAQGIGIDDLSIDQLIHRIDEEGVKELIIATNPTIEGETTALYLAKILEKQPVKITRLAYGLPMGGHVDYADALTLSKALEGRTKMKDED